MLSYGIGYAKQIMPSIILLKEEEQENEEMAFYEREYEPLCRDWLQPGRAVLPPREG